MEVGVSNRVVARSQIGQFIRDCEVAGEKTVEKAIKRGETLSKQLAPVGVKADPRTKSLRDSIESRMLSRTSGEWVATARHALPIEKGAAPHDIPGEVSFFWENMGRNWIPGTNVINHPGNAAQPYLRPAYEIVMRDIMAIARGEYPG
jgi:hypothetical protein